MAVEKSERMSEGSTNLEATKTLRVGVFDTPEKVDKVVEQLLEEGYIRDQVAVICSEEAVREHFPKDIAEEPSGDEHTKERMLTGSGIGAALGGLTALLGIATAGGALVFTVGGILASTVTGGVLGGFIGLMSSRGVESNAADFYDQAVTEGKILVAVEDHDVGRLRRVEQVFEKAGSHPIPMREG